MPKPHMPGRPSDRHAVKARLRQAGLHTVCEEARCPNIGECFGAGTATFLILGDACTRRCGFCGVRHEARPSPPDPAEPHRLAATVAQLGLDHAVITSVTRDDLPDGGAGQFVACLAELRRACPGTTTEVLVPDFAGQAGPIGAVLDAGPDVFNHNVETVERLALRVRPQADFERSLGVLWAAARHGSALVKSGLMVGLGEDDDEVDELLGRLAQAGCQAVTIGQYLQPTRANLPVLRQVGPAAWECYRSQGERLGLRVVAGPLVRSSWRAHELLEGRPAGC